MKKSIENVFSRRIAVLFIYSSIILAGFGIYLGRVLRWNSWDIIRNPTSLIEDVFYILLNPKENIEAYSITIIFSIIIFMGYRLTNHRNAY